MAEHYNHKEVERKWQERWEQSGAFTAPETPRGEKLYILDMFPYPSGEGLHVGHVEGYTATDIYSRYQRMRGKHVLHPMGWDSFGLPAENYAIKTGIHPKETTEKAINNFRSQIKRLGLSYDWSREVGAHTPEYYRWTQWLFTKFFEKGLVYKKKALVNWDPVDQTVLANEQVLPDGTAERSGAVVEKKELEQWFFKITDYADELIEGLEEVDWPESTKTAQRNWIGRSEGAEIDFAVAGGSEKITVFTTRPDTLFGATYLVVAPEHLLIKDLIRGADNKDEILRYIEVSVKKTEIERTSEGREKTGVELKGVRAINPATKEEIPIYVADYVLAGYGTGAIMAVPAHDERDYAFAKKFNLPVRQVIEPVHTDSSEQSRPRPDLPFIDRGAVNVIVKHWSEEKYLCLQWKQVNWRTFVTGGIEEGQTPEEAARMEVREETGYTDLRFVRDLGRAHSKFYHNPKKVNRFAHFHILYFELQSDAHEEMSPEEREKHDVLWVEKDKVNEFLANDKEFLYSWKLLTNPEQLYTGEGILANSGEFSGLPSEEAKQKIADAADGRMRKTYRLRDWLISRQRYWGAPIPVVYDPEGKPHAVPEEHLPWLLPTDVEFKPTGTSPLGQSKELLERTERIFGKGWRPEVDTMDTFVCSSWYFFRFADPRNEQEFASREALQRWLPVDLYVGGAEHTVLHLLYARFFTKALRDMDYLSFDEPFLKLRHQGLILAEDSRKMSKRWGNVINPDDVVEQYGADAVRMYEMFMGPLEAMKPWNTKNIAGIKRFLDRVWRMSEKVSSEENRDFSEDLLHQTIKKVGEDIENLKMNTAISQLMIFLNQAEAGGIDVEKWKIFLQLLAPFAPHLAEELWERLGERDLIYQVTWPEYDESKIRSATVPVAVQVNGKTRATIELPAQATETEALTAARANSVVSKWLKEGSEVKAIYVPGKIISFVVKKG